MATLDITEKAPVLDQDGNQLNTTEHQLYSSDAGVCGVEFGTGLVFAVAGHTGDATLSAVRLADGATASLGVTVTANALGGFSISLGTAIPK